MALERRVYRRDLRDALGYSDEWLRILQKRGDIPRGQRDPGGNREWFTETQAREIIERRNGCAQAAA
jgi:hypothetical protein